MKHDRVHTPKHEKSTWAQMMVLWKVLPQPAYFSLVCTYLAVNLLNWHIVYQRLFNQKIH